MTDATALNVEAASDMGKINIVTYPPLPGNCAVCLRGTDGERKFIDFQLSFDFEGAVVICVDCWAPVAQILGYLSPDKVEILKSQVTTLHTRVEELQAENAQLNAALDSIVTVRPNLQSRPLVNDEGAYSSVGEDREQLSFDLGTTGSDDRKVTESATERGLKDTVKSQHKL